MPKEKQDFISRWQQSEAAERSNYALFLSELCDFLDVPRPEPSQGIEDFNTYVIDKTVEVQNLDGTVSRGFIDLYKKNHFVLEAKQGSNPLKLQVDDENNLILSSPSPRPQRRRGTALRGTHGWDEAMRRAYYQAEDYAKALPEWPPFLVTVDVGHSIELYADFSLTGKAYLPFPDPRTYRILLNDLTVPEVRERLRALWLDPHSLDPSRRTAEVTRGIAAKLANLARNLEQKYPAKDVAEFLTRCIFTSFAENVELIPKDCWLNLLRDIRDRENVKFFPQMASSLWETMNTGGFSPILQSELKQFNGGLFQCTNALPLTRDQLGLLIEAADSDWRNVEPAIFGTLLERALDKKERSSLGAHYTPRAYVERLVIPTIVEPLREDWNNTVAAIADLVHTDDVAEAVQVAREFHRKLCDTYVLDPACGSGNFLYVALEHMKRLEGEVLETLASLGQPQELYTVNPHQLLGIELNPRAAVVADLVLWIGYLQWHLRTRSSEQIPIPVISNFHNITHQDALIIYGQKVPAVDLEGNEVKEWDGVTTTMHPVTGWEVPDETARRTIYHYHGAKQSLWPSADFVIGNPPFIGGKDMRQELPGGYTDTLRQVYQDVPDSADFVMFWWQHAAELARSGKVRRFGFITTNSLTQVFNRRVVAQNLSAAKNPLSLIFAIPDHPWLKALTSDEETISKAAAVRIAMTVAERGEHEGHLYHVISEGDTGTEGTAVELSDSVGKILADLRIGADVSGAAALQSNEGLSCPGVKLHGAGFIVSPEEAETLGLRRIPGLEQHIRPYLNGRDLTGTSRNKLVIDLFGLSAAEVQERFPEVYQWVYDRVKPERDENRRATYSENWWTFGEPRANFRPALKGLSRYIATVETAKHRVFVFVDASVLPDNRLVNFAFSDGFDLGVLSSSIHVAWTLAAGGTLEDRPIYTKSRCFDPFPFPDCKDVQKRVIRDLADRLDAHRKRQQELHPSLTLTEIYNVLQKLRSNEDLTEQDHHIYDAGLVGTLRELHENLDLAVFDAYGWSYNLTTERILEHVVALNAARHAEEASGLIRWLRPEYQAPSYIPKTATLEGFIEEVPTTRRKQPWPSAIPDQFRIVKDAMRSESPQTPQQIAANFRPAPRTRVAEILATLTALGQARESSGRYSV
ncbi:DNA methyltransferase [Edaphobacter sp. DSM 109919]|uniref:site-specific DNA-methyltransferase (adenine-specific) n=1 Tax=Edaphobacter paludis TaxID=3035702 RepID=A0AAU7CUH0_9BACT